ncbi:hypothetical protein C4K11_2764 [Pseudomonas chlororaphis subsp. aureofaciens]|uniref:Uncharacterized protein n=1 Tax=Pseudomonas chlororaphis subsp. aureofaciens TaxID=587851 RepID=A0AAD0ZPA1_9PSED|nr:hypothetical protein C4K15_2784 [Pseudomonas chlororaphis subsp. aurantiaca]AZE04926.1 hypothetical protein C4K11_2764 [Pseudomonas chlororaphis subsp. aureofaciens]AZE29551.1 hypothetical protein C4K07_2766 [Pseudomonas chlororaphis subsp. aureofaciens]
MWKDSKSFELTAAGLQNVEGINKRRLWVLATRFKGLLGWFPHPGQSGRSPKIQVIQDCYTSS